MDDSKGLSCFLIGIGVGVAVGLLFAPKSVPETRGLLREKAGEGGDYLKRRGEDLRDQAAGALERGKQVVGRQREHLSAAVDAGKQAYRETVSGPEEPVSTLGSRPDVPAL